MPREPNICGQASFKSKAQCDLVIGCRRCFIHCRCGCWPMNAHDQDHDDRDAMGSGPMDGHEASIHATWQACQGTRCAESHYASFGRLQTARAQTLLFVVSAGDAQLFDNTGDKVPGQEVGASSGGRSWAHVSAASRRLIRRQPAEALACTAQGQLAGSGRAAASRHCNSHTMSLAKMRVGHKSLPLPLSSPRRAEDPRSTPRQDLPGIPPRWK